MRRILENYLLPPVPTHATRLLMMSGSLPKKPLLLADGKKQL